VSVGNFSFQNVTDYFKRFSNNQTTTFGQLVTFWTAALVDRFEELRMAKWRIDSKALSVSRQDLFDTFFERSYSYKKTPKGI
jgi:hypothetical protein